MSGVPRSAFLILAVLAVSLCALWWTYGEDIRPPRQPGGESAVEHDESGDVRANEAAHRRVPAASSHPQDTAEVRIIVSGPDSKPIRGAQVWAEQAPGRVVAQSSVVGVTDERGEVAVLLARPTHIGAAATGYQPVAHALSEDSPSVIRLRLVPGLDLRVRIENLDSSPVVGVPLVASRRLVGGEIDLWAVESQLFPSGIGPRSAHVATSEEGGYAVFRGLPQGLYDVRPCPSTGMVTVVGVPDARGPYAPGNSESRLRVARLVGACVSFASDAGEIRDVDVFRRMSSADPQEQRAATAAIRSILHGSIPEDSHLFLWPAASMQPEGTATATFLSSRAGHVRKEVRFVTWDRIPEHVQALDVSADNASVGSMSAQATGPAGEALRDLEFFVRKRRPEGFMDTLPTVVSSGEKVHLDAGDYEVRVADAIGSLTKLSGRVTVLAGQHAESKLELGARPITAELVFATESGAKVNMAALRIHDGDGNPTRADPFFESGRKLTWLEGEQFVVSAQLWPFDRINFRLDSSTIGTDRRGKLVFPD